MSWSFLLSEINDGNLASSGGSRGNGHYQPNFWLKSGDTLITEPNEVHNVANSSGLPFKYIVFKSNVIEGDRYWRTDYIIESDQWRVNQKGIVPALN